MEFTVETHTVPSAKLPSLLPFFIASPTKVDILLYQASLIKFTPALPRAFSAIPLPKQIFNKCLI